MYIYIYICNNLETLDQGFKYWTGLAGSTCSAKPVKPASSPVHLYNLNRILIEPVLDRELVNQFS